MIDKYDKDFLPFDPPVPSPLNTHLGHCARCEVSSGQRGQRSVRTVAELGENRGCRDETQVSVVVGVAGETRPDIPSFHLEGAPQ